MNIETIEIRTHVEECIEVIVVGIDSRKEGPQKTKDIERSILMGKKH